MQGLNPVMEPAGANANPTSGNGHVRGFFGQGKRSDNGRMPGQECEMEMGSDEQRWSFCLYDEVERKVFDQAHSCERQQGQVKKVRHGSPKLTEIHVDPVLLV